MLCPEATGKRTPVALQREGSLPWLSPPKVLAPFKRNRN